MTTILNKNSSSDDNCSDWYTNIIVIAIAIAIGVITIGVITINCIICVCLNIFHLFPEEVM